MGQIYNDSLDNHIFKNNSIKYFDYVNFKNDEKIIKELTKLKHKCKCGHTMIIPLFKDKIICSHCGHYVYKTKLDEFKNKLQIQLRKGNK